ncbi:hypothetical protein CKO44_11225 [Rubrivivax gelatinosus]|uniref:DUF3106 domain-containing protein n=1 Tax=Rubrivivax gelatinosus TaxID=28068 RepID=UPI001902F8C9|nr:DUF3106 domain-containing protein [Rubrivivax gelatinosus]MBK1614038.1 hypothetical protein [Rubrivivax gelatinosus]
MHKFTPALLLAVAATAASAAFAQGATPERREALKEKWESMTPEQQAQAREKLRQRWQQMTPEEREAAKKRMGERRGGARGPAAASAPAGS